MRTRGVALRACVVSAALLVAGCSSAGGKHASATTASGSRPSVTSPRAETSLPVVTSSDATVRSLWQVDRLAEQVVIDDAVVGVVQTGKQSTLHAVAAATGKPLWTYALPVAEPQTLGVSAAQGVVVAEVGYYPIGSAGGPQSPIVTQLVVVDARTGAHLWSEHVGGRTQTPPVAIASGVVVLGDPVGTLIARNVRSGRRVWQRSRPATCPRAGPVQYDEAVAADGSLLAVSYQCATHGNSTLVQRLNVSTGVPLWQYPAPSVLPLEHNSVSVIGAAASGGVVVVAGTPYPPFVSALGRGTSFPTGLAANGNEAIVALDATDGFPRWTEDGTAGPDFVRISLTDHAICETASAGFECRDDATGEPTRPVFTSGYGQSAIPPYYSDALAGIGGDIAASVVPTSATDSVAADVMPVRGTRPVARLNVDVGTSTVDGSRYDTFVVGSAQLANGATLVLLRRIDLKTYPLLAISVTSHASTAKK
jgi:outer membrane protein assembly factor BamB